MQVSKISAINNVKASSNSSFTSNNVNAEENKQDIFEQFAAQKLPEGKAIQIGHKPGLSLINILMLPFGFIGFSIKPTMTVVDINKDKLTDKQKELIRKGKMIDYVPRGYHVDGNKVKKNK